MLKHLIKYEWKAMRWHYAVPFLVYIVAAVVCLAIAKTYPIATVLVITLGLFALAVLMFYTFFQRYNSNLYGNEGYLMFTLPVKTEELLFSKALVSFIWFTLYMVLIFAVICFAALRFSTHIHAGELPPLTEIWNALYPHIGDFLLVLFYYIVSILSGILYIYFAITVSKFAIWRRFGVLMGFVAYAVINIVEFIPIWILEFGFHAKVDVAQNLVKIQRESGPAHVNIQIGSLSGWFWLLLPYTIAFAVGTFFLIAWLMRKFTSLK